MLLLADSRSRGDGRVTGVRAGTAQTTVRAAPIIGDREWAPAPVVRVSRVIGRWLRGNSPGDRQVAPLSTADGPQRHRLGILCPPHGKPPLVVLFVETTCL
jgi:hypothetical protein